jgi:hypothetical protein
VLTLRQTATLASTKRQCAKAKVPITSITSITHVRNASKNRGLLGDESDLAKITIDHIDHIDHVRRSKRSGFNLPPEESSIFRNTRFREARHAVVALERRAHDVDRQASALLDLGIRLGKVRA